VADLIVILHFLFIVFVIIGGLFVYNNPRLAWLHIPMVLWAFLVNIMEWICPLTPLENLYRKAAGEPGYESGFVDQYLTPLIYPEAMSYQMGVLLGISVLIWNFLVYYFLIFFRKKRKNLK